ncbi:MAG: hypothetical protein L6W00_04160 [Lentisphaeria bacterium]|nr:MAG: hypothetical protein L6W00_04160 [Lentisphaeria bacterium]
MSEENRQKIDKNLEIRNRLLDRIESGEWKTGDKLPGGADPCPRSRLLLHPSAERHREPGAAGHSPEHPRNGTFVRENWEKRLIQKSFLLYESKFIDDLRQELAPLTRNNPALWVTSKSHRAIYEIRVSHYLLGHHAEYMDLTPIFDRLFPDPDLFFTPLLDAFRINGKLYGIPLLFSPRIIVFNRRIFAENNVPFPRRNWSWEEFMQCVWTLRQKLPAEKAFLFTASPFQFTTIAARFGGNFLISPGRTRSLWTLRSCSGPSTVFWNCATSSALPAERCPPTRQHYISRPGSSFTVTCHPARNRSLLQ